MDILFADSDESIALPIIAYLNALGHCVTYVQDGLAVLDSCNHQLPDLVIMDVVLPEMDATEVTRRIKVLTGSSWLPVLLMTSLGDKKSIVSGIDSGADDFLIKPIDYDILALHLQSKNRTANMKASMSSILENVYEAILTINKTGKIESCNKAAERIFGYTPAEIIGNNVKMLMPSPYSEEHDSYLSRYQNEHTPRVIGIGRKVHGRRKNGEVFPMRLAVTELHSGNGYIGLVSDITSEEAAREQAVADAEAIAKSANFIKMIADSLPGMIAYWDKDLRCHFANAAYQEWFGKSAAEIIGTYLFDLLGEHLFSLNQSYIQGALDGVPQKFERTMVKADGNPSYTWVTYTPDMNSQGDVVGFFVLVGDITQLKMAEDQLKLAASVYQNTIEGIIVTDTEGTILSVNPAFIKITGYSSEEAVGQNRSMLKSNRHDQKFYADIRRCLATKGWWEGDIWHRHKDGGFFLAKMNITKIPDSTANTFRYAALFHDVTEMRLKDEQVRHLAFHDILTDLPNRQLLLERINYQIGLNERENRRFSILFLDLDGFKMVNDTFGHEIGDDLLKLLANKFLSLVRHSDTVARLGGDEFVILLGNPLGENYIAEIASRIILVINEPMEIRGKSVKVGSSIGIAIYPEDGKTSLELVKNADTAMYAAKNAGKNTYRFFTAAMTK